MTDIATDSTMSETELDALRARYRVERDRRVRPDGLRQYQGTRGAFGYWATDPYTPRTDRPEKTDRVEVLVVGGGFGGLLTGARLRQAGFTDIRMTEEGGRLRRDVVLEPVPGHPLRHRGLRLHATARGGRDGPHTAVRTGGRRSGSTRWRWHGTSTCTTTCCSTPV
ncbi:hypothetical protein [Curtobacterium sp. MCJR17_043]|uniref:hypothetical protein n=1 Tax=Curtobacterium sp. MCJR17_043 TaxID=2175660 RepID=UPI0024DFE360|nr:hypothetical protein [Curtobacterium sp. MCJR17_043]WIB36048.1 hypothetical protein DEJ15_01840 [Curtobacterium sp. MCJR17_043]